MKNPSVAYLTKQDNKKEGGWLKWKK